MTYLLKLSDDEHKRLKTLAAKIDLTMKEVLLKGIELVEKQNKS